jgi:hypothetical protein
MVAVDIGHTITVVILPRLDLFLLRLILDLVHTIIICNQHILVFFLHCYRGKNRVDDVVEAIDLMLQLRDGVLC